ncbi:kelch domain-containing protein 10 isoform X2 [Cephus cinctus]|uniref:Kelch domain-containing protein 10 isoform X2 n=1 Tax=Cephus cinctus TaxID=211228 RepID=A0AAJ7FMH1_CEPCN|nr:kelch domain-containing protein 10 isoform X2 [Cephus cinctus]
MSSWGTTYRFKPFRFEIYSPENQKWPKGRSGHRIACNERYLYSYGGYNPDAREDTFFQDPTWFISRPLFKEIWRFNLATHRWKRLPKRRSLPNEMASCAVVLRGDILIVYGGTGFPFGETCSNKVYLCNVKDGSTKPLPATGKFPESLYGIAVVCHGPYLYTVGGTSGYDFHCDIHRIDLRTGVWESVYICTGADGYEPEGRYRHELAYDGKRIYVFGGGTTLHSPHFSIIPTFDLESNKWMSLATHGKEDCKYVPADRLCHSVVQYTDDKTGVTYAVIFGGFNGDEVFRDMWRLDLKLLQWTCLLRVVDTDPVYFHSASITPEGCMYSFGGVIRNGHQTRRSDTVLAVWLKIPKLTEISWLALNHYCKNLKDMSKSDLLLLGIPLNFVQRLIDDDL